MRHKHLFVIFVLLALAAPASPAQAGGIVSVCDEAHLLAAVAGGGTVTFACSGTITLTAEITIAADTAIDGSGQTVAISGNNAVRVFTVSSGATLNLNELTVANGSASSGGGIHNYGTVTVSNSTFSGNSGSGGGAIYNNSGPVTVRNSTFSGNSAHGSGGGISNCLGTVTVSNSTFSGNSAGAGGGIDNYSNSSSTVTLKNTIVANSPQGGNCSGTITDGGGNLSYPDATCPGINTDPKLGPLQNNGGPTETIGLGSGSAALDVGNDATCAAPPVNNLDQRGVTRPQGLHCDIGAVEQFCPDFVTPTTIGVEDVVAIAERWGWTDSTPGWDPAYDLNLDSKVDIVDIMLVTAAWGRTCS